jgi:CRP-like cAMP-binding protein
MLQRMNVPFFREIPTARLDTLADVAQLITVLPDEVVLREGEVSSKFYLVMFGDVAVSTRSADTGRDEERAVLRAGQYFGEIGLVTDMPRTATVTAKTKTILFAFGREEFSQCFAGYREAYAEFSIKLSRHEVPLASVLRHPSARECLEQFCAKELSLENLHFYQAVELFHRRFANTSRDAVTELLDDSPGDRRGVRTVFGYEDMVREALYVWNTFVAPGEADQEVNLKADNIAYLRGRLLEAPTGPDGLPEDVDAGVFDKAQEEILLVMRDTHRRFVKDPLFDQLLTSLGSYKVETPVDTARLNELARN